METSNRDLQTKVFLITGASTGIGRAIALALAGRGCRMCLAARNVERLQDTVQKARELGGEVLAVPTDVTDCAQVEHLADEVLRAWGKVDVLISNAGQYVRAPVMDMTMVDLHRSMEVNFYGHVRLVQAVLPGMTARRSGHIILVASMDAKKGISPDAPYVSAKFALSGFGEVLRQEMRPYKIAVTTIYPGRVDTPMIASLRFHWLSAKISSETAALTILRAVRTRPAEVIFPPQAFLLHLMNFFSPRLADWFVRQLRLEGWNSESMKR